MSNIAIPTSQLTKEKVIIEPLLKDESDQIKRSIIKEILQEGQALENVHEFTSVDKTNNEPYFEGVFAFKNSSVPLAIGGGSSTYSQLYFQPFKHDDINDTIDLTNDTEDIVNENAYFKFIKDPADKTTEINRNRDLEIKIAADAISKISDGTVTFDPVDSRTIKDGTAGSRIEGKQILGGGKSKRRRNLRRRTRRKQM